MVEVVLVRPDGLVEAWGFWRFGGMEMDWVGVDMEQRSGEKVVVKVELYRKGQMAGRESEVRWERGMWLAGYKIAQVLLLERTSI
jgi:hypothetical protein